MATFNEASLRADIVKAWGEHGAHVDVFDAILAKASLANDLEHRLEVALDELAAAEEQICMAGD